MIKETSFWGSIICCLLFFVYLILLGYALYFFGNVGGMITTIIGIIAAVGCLFLKIGKKKK